MAAKERECNVCNSLIVYRHKNKPILCPECSATYWDKPADERDLFVLQDRYIADGRRTEDLGPIYEKLKVYATNIIKHKLRNLKIISQDDLESKSNDIAIIMTERYLKKPTEKIESSFGGMMLKIANGVLFGNRKQDQELSLNDHLSSSDKELGDQLYAMSQAYVENYEDNDPQNNFNLYTMQDIKKEFQEIINQIYKRIRVHHSSQSFLFLVGLNNFLSGQKDIFIRNFNNLITNKTKNDIEKTKLVLRNHLLKQHRG